jgi:aryl-alcohol dehydrogenase-like predicted oxidoreductase
MKHRHLGRSDLSVAPLAFGGNVFGWTADRKTSHRLLDHFVERGFNLVDTADVYSKWVPGHQGGESETILGEWLAQGGGRRDKIVLATKVGMPMSDKETGLARERIMAAVDASLKRLKTDHIDLYQAHQDDPKVPLEETLTAFNDLIKAGKVRVIGASNYSAQRLTETLAISAEKKIARYETLQPLYNLLERQDFEADVLPLCEKNDIGVIPYSSLASGFLTGKYRSEKDLGKSPRGKNLGRYLDQRGHAVLAALDDASKKLGCTQGCVALAWLMKQSTISAPIASATSIDQLDQLLKAAEIDIDDETANALQKASEGKT